MDNQSPDREDQEENDADGVGDAVRLREGVSESARRSDVLLQKVTPDEETYQDPDPTLPQRVREEVRRHN